MKNEAVLKLIKKLDLSEHPEGGFFKQTYCSKDLIKPPERYEGETRSSSTHIYYLLESKDFSAWHRIKSDEIWHYYSGSPLTLYIISEDRALQKVVLGDPLKTDNANYQYCVKHGLWFSAAVSESNNFTLVGCTVSPGFDYRDWELAERNELIASYPEHKEIITKFTKEVADKPS